MKNIEVSIIIPVYNAENYLEETLDSLVNQSFKNFEVVLIDDGSTDNSGIICDRYCSMDHRFSVYHIPNGGVSAARNYALDHINGEYLMFIDSDDLVKPEYIQTLYDAVVENKSELAVCSYMKGWEGTVSDFNLYHTSKSPKVLVLTREQFRFTNHYAHFTVWAGIYKRSIIKNKRFASDLFVGEDTLFFAELVNEAETYVYIDEKYYYYRYRTDSLAHATYNARQSTEIDAWERICLLFENMSREFSNECKTALALRLRKNYIKAKIANFEDQAMIDSFHQKGKKLLKNVLQSKELSMKAKAAFALFVFHPYYVINRTKKRGGKYVR